MADDEFVWAVDQDIREFIAKANQKSVLIFPPVNNYRRFLIHKVCESVTADHELVTFSIGVGSERRTVVCYRHQLLRDVKAISTKSFEESTESAPVSWRSTTVGPALVGTSTSASSSSSVSAGGNHSNCSAPSNNSSVGSGSNSGTVASGSASVNTGASGKKRAKRDLTSTLTVNAGGGGGSSSASSGDSNSKMGVEAAAVNHHNHHQGHYFGGANDCGSLKGSPLASSPPSAVKFSAVGIYRPPAARKALKFSESAIQLAPPAAGDNPNEYGHYHPPPPIPSATQAQHVSAAKTASEENLEDPPPKPPPSSVVASKSPCKATATGSVSRAPKQEATGDDSSATKTDSSTPPTKAITAGKSKLTVADVANAAVIEAADSNNNNTGNSAEQPLVAAAVTSQGNQTSSSSTTTTRPARPHRERRPDRAVYIPRARRSLTTPPVTAPSQQQSSTSASTSVTSASTTVTSPPSPPVSTSGSLSAFATPLSSPPKVPSKKERSNGERERKSKAKDKPPPPPADTVVPDLEVPNIANTVIVNHRKNDSAASVDSNCTVSFKNRSHSVEESVPANGVHQELVKLKKQKSEEVPRENVDQDCDFAPKAEAKRERKERQNGSILSELNGSTNHKAIETMNKSNRSRSSKQISGNATALIINDKIGTNAADKIDKDERELRRASQEINRSNRRIIKQSFASDVLEIAEQEPAEKDISTEKVNGQAKQDPERLVNPEEDDWESMYDDNGDCLNPKLMEELTSAVGKVSIEVPRTDYKLYQTKQAALNEEEFPHVLEVSNFPVEFRTQDLMMLFSQYKESGFDIKWVDDTHALAVFSSSKIAAEVLANGHTFVKLKPLAEATVESRSKARKCSSSLQPYRPRPETCAALARRLVTTALGVRLKTAPEERENEKRVLREAKERKLLAAKQREEIWES